MSDKKRVFTELNSYIQVYVDTLPKFVTINDSWLIFKNVLMSLIRGIIIQFLSDKLPNYIEKTKLRFEFLLPFFDNIYQMREDSNFSIILHYFLSLIANPLAETFDKDFVNYKLLLNGENKSNVLDLSINLKNKIKSLALSNESLFIYHKINAYDDRAEQIKIHLGNLLDSILDKKIFLVDKISNCQKAETTFDCSIYISKINCNFLYYCDNSNELFQENFSNLCSIILNEISHVHRIQYALKNYFLKHSPINLEEKAKIFFESNLFGFNQILKNRDSKVVFLDKRKKIEIFRNKLIEIANPRTYLPMKNIKIS